nr:MAG TPA: hypothetical protein [Caudoviricetes sp.]
MDCVPAINGSRQPISKKISPSAPTPELIRLPGKPINHLEQVHFIIFPDGLQCKHMSGHFYAHFSVHLLRRNVQCLRK